MFKISYVSKLLWVNSGDQGVGRDHLMMTRGTDDKKCESQKCIVSKSRLRVLKLGLNKLEQCQNNISRA